MQSRNISQMSEKTNILLMPFWKDDGDYDND